MAVQENNVMDDLEELGWYYNALNEYKKGIQDLVESPELQISIEKAKENLFSDDNLEI